ncbi:MAG: alpha-ketoglutarate-dependent dioxygenase AlkB, partial [Aeromicrobium sp.]
MSDYYQGSLLDAGLPPEIGALAPQRTMLGDGAWVDVLPGWVSGSDDLFLRLESEVPWQAERREMYDRVVDVPRLLSHYGVGDPLPDPVLLEARERLSDHYEAELGERFATAGLCLYRDGRDSVAWHGDRIGRGRTGDTMVAILSLGAARR